MAEEFENIVSGDEKEENFIEAVHTLGERVENGTPEEIEQTYQEALKAAEAIEDESKKDNAFKQLEAWRVRIEEKTQ